MFYFWIKATYNEKTNDIENHYRKVGFTLVLYSPNIEVNLISEIALIRDTPVNIIGIKYKRILYFCDNLNGILGVADVVGAHYVIRTIPRNEIGLRKKILFNNKTNGKTSS